MPRLAISADITIQGTAWETVDCPKKNFRPLLWPRRESQGPEEHTELASGKGTRQWLEEMGKSRDILI